ncbi:MAG: hypothetical protein Q8K02_13705 [Flavobacterium sp.]|nr:hypothetical protein [Flavobacterium sp.]
MKNLAASVSIGDKAELCLRHSRLVFRELLSSECSREKPDEDNIIFFFVNTRNTAFETIWSPEILVQQFEVQLRIHFLFEYEDLGIGGLSNFGLSVICPAFKQQFPN